MYHRNFSTCSQRHWRFKFSSNKSWLWEAIWKWDILKQRWNTVQCQKDTIKGRNYWFLRKTIPFVAFLPSPTNQSHFISDKAILVRSQREIQILHATILFQFPYINERVNSTELNSRQWLPYSGLIKFMINQTEKKSTLISVQLCIYV